VDGKGLFAEVVSKMDSEKDASALLKKSFEGFPRSCLKIEVKGEPKLLEKSDTKATVLIQIEVSVDPKAYKAFSSKLQTVLEKLVSEKKSKGEFLIKSEEIILSEGNKYLKSGDIHFKFKEWMPDGSLPDMSLNSSRSVSNTKSIILSLCNHSNDKADNLGFAFYFLDKSFKPILLASAFELLNGKLVLVDESDESIFIDKFKLIEFDKGREMTFEGQMTVTSDWHENGSSSFNRRSNSPGEKFMGESSIFFISPSFFSVDNHDFCYKPTLLINRNIELSLEELKKIKKAKVEISPP
jgi:hypothetical protein